MNFIAYDRAISLYPLATFELRTNERIIPYGTRPMTLQSADQAIEKYKARDFQVVSMRTMKDTRAIFQHGCDREVGDRWCWTVKFNMTDVDPSRWLEQQEWGLETESIEMRRREPEDPIMINKWRVSGRRGRIKMKYCILRLPIFRYAYSVADESEAIRAREFSDAIAIVKKGGGRIGRKWFDDNVRTVTTNSVLVWLDGRIINSNNEMRMGELGQAEPETPGVPPMEEGAFPIKVTETMHIDDLRELLYSYGAAFDELEKKSQAWRKRRDGRRALSGRSDD
ncbi:hypothetical protein HWV62_347 [Athelia sp. TMB]|nr:hypothetical protein HWV62_347 [Athelia sp. TMB]